LDLQLGRGAVGFGTVSSVGFRTGPCRFTLKLDRVRGARFETRLEADRRFDIGPVAAASVGLVSNLTGGDSSV
jgi:hypothetical protein